ncbi:MAG TPA: N-acetyltransferase, partial [Pirellulales bacterium]|nr:N-acetyltransferase [Pirellulales bacterium]
MGLTYYKRYQMEIDLGRLSARPNLPAGYRFVGWSAELLPLHAEAKSLSFRNEIDASVFPCLADYDGCLRLMQEISRKDGFLPAATWLLVRNNVVAQRAEICGTVQGIRDRHGLGAIQNLGIVPEHRNLGLGSALLVQALDGFRQSGLRRAFLEVTAQNDGAVRLYRRLGFVKARTVYKAVELFTC